METRKNVEIKLTYLNREMNKEKEYHKRKLLAISSEYKELYRYIINEQLYISSLSEYFEYLKENRPDIKMANEIPNSFTFSNFTIFFENEDGTKDYTFIEGSLYANCENMHIISIEDKEDGTIVEFDSESNSYKWYFSGKEVDEEECSTIKILGFF